jgi:hypothetical protein
MYLHSLLYATALCATVANADFFVYTEPPIPTSAIPSFSDTAEVRPFSLLPSIPT